jgi:hypothetical protein
VKKKKNNKKKNLYFKKKKKKKKKKKDAFVTNPRQVYFAFLADMGWKAFL